MGKYGNRPRQDKSVLTEPLCPFCGESFAPPAEISTRLGFITGGRCVCGAVYVFDPSKKNMGEAFMDALAYACNDDWDLAMSLKRDTDYDEALLAYDHATHTLAAKRCDDTRYRSNKNLLLIKLKKALRRT
jgi:hypothetical protein